MKQSAATGETEAQLRARIAELEQLLEVRDRTTTEHSEESCHSLFRTLANSIPQLAWMADETGWTFWYNQRWYDYTGTTLDEMEGWGWRKVHHPDEVDRVVERITRAFETGEPWEDTFPLRSKTGEYRWFLSRALPIRDAEGHVVRWFGTNTDITVQRTAAQRLAAQNAASRVLTEAAEEEDVFPEVLRAICKALGWGIGIIWRLDRTANVLRPVGLWYDPALPVEEFAAASWQRTFAPGVGLPGRVWQSGATAWIPDVVRDANFPRARMAEPAGVHSAFAIPIHDGGPFSG